MRSPISGVDSVGSAELMNGNRKPYLIINHRLHPDAGVSRIPLSRKFAGFTSFAWSYLK